MKILSIDTATEICSVALLWNGEVIESFVEQPQGHGVVLLKMMDEILSEAGIELKDLDVLGFGCGPGSFTGVRMAVSVAQAVGFGIGLPLVPVSNLAMLAQGLYRIQGIRCIIPALDARMQEVYVCSYEVVNGVVEATNEEQVISPNVLALNLNGNDWYGVGRGWVMYNEILKMRLAPHVLNVVPELLCHAQDSLPLIMEAVATGRTVSPELALPVYLRNQVVQKR